MVEQLIAMEELKNRGSQFFFYRTHTGTEIDLLIDRGQERSGYEFKSSSTVSSDDAAALKRGIDDGIIHKGFVVYPGKHSFPISDKISAIPAEDLLTLVNQ